MRRLVGVVILSFILIVPYVAEAACAWVLWVEESWIAVYQRDERPPQWTLVEAHAQPAGCEQAQAEKIKTLSEGRDVRVHSNIVSETFPSGHAQTNIIRWYRVVCVPDTTDPRGPKAGGR